MNAHTPGGRGLPLYARISLITVGIVAFFDILYVGRDIIVPLIFALILAILLNPLVDFLTGKGLNRVIAILLSVLLALAAIGGLAYFIVFEIGMFSDTLPSLESRFSELLEQLIRWLSSTFNIAELKILAWLESAKAETMSNSTAFVGRTLGTISGALVLVFLIPVYIFLIIYYKSRLLEFIAMISKDTRHHIVTEVLSESQTLIQRHLTGILLEAVAVAVLNAVGLLVIGIDYAVLIAIIGAILNMIPFIGGLVAICLPVFMALVTRSPAEAFWVLVLYVSVLVVDNYFLFPRIVSSRVKVNALVSIASVLVGGSLWGIPGMFLSLPIIAIMKVIFDRVEPLKPFGHLIGAESSHVKRN